MNDESDLIRQLPIAPNPREESLLSIRDRREWTALFFEWHKTIAEAALLFSFMQKTSPALKKIDNLKYVLLTALLNRCARLMMANLRAASEDRHDEAISILNRSIKESAIKLMWLCETKSRDRFKRMLADGLKGDLELKAHITKNIKERGHKIAIEDRMLKSIQLALRTAKLSEKYVRNSKKLANLQILMNEVGLPDLSYVVIQRMGSHSVHGTWSGMLAHNLDVAGSSVTLRPDFNSPHPNGLMITSLIVLEALRSFVLFTTKRNEHSDPLVKVDSYRSELLRHNSIMARADSDRV